MEGTGRDGRCEFSRRDGTVKYKDLLFHDGTGRYMKIVTTGRDGMVNRNCHDGTVYFLLLDGTGRCIKCFTTGRDGI